jgi:hypothetical protein
MTTAEAIIHYQRTIRCHPRHGAYVTLDTLNELGARPDGRTIRDALFAIINWQNAPLFDKEYDLDEDDSDDIEFWALD